MKKIINNLVVFGKYEQDILIYGVKVILFNVISIFLILLIAYIFHCFLFGIIFISSFGFVRIKIGGFHCKSLQLCIIVLLSLFILIYYLSKLMFFRVIIMCLSIPSIICFYYLLKKENKEIFKGYFVFMLFILIMFENILIPFYSGVILGEILYLYNMIYN